MEKNGLCINCYESITNPVCIDCYINQINYWLRDSDIMDSEKRMIVEEIRKKLVRKIPAVQEELVKCTICGKEEVSICSYCFFLRTDRIIRKLNVEGKLKKNFLEIFNYRHGNEEY